MGATELHDDGPRRERCRGLRVRRGRNADTPGAPQAGSRYSDPVAAADPSILSRRWLPLTSSVVATISLTAFNILAVVAALPQITAELGDVSLLSWVITGFLVTSTLATMVAGPAMDAFGVSATFRATMVFFLIGSAACAAAPSMLALVVFRGVQGVGAGLAFAVATAAIGIAYPERLRPRALAAISVAWGVMALGGPTLAALFVATTGWRGIFLINIPIAIGAGALGWSRMPPRATDAGRGFEVGAWGVAILGAFTVVSLVGFSDASVVSGVAVVVAALLGAGYWVYTRRAPSPVIERRYFARHPIGTTNLAFGLAFGAALGIDAYLPIYVKAGLGYSVVIAAFSVAFLTLGWTTASLAMSRLLDRYSETPTALVGFGLLIPAIGVGLAVYDANTPIAVVLAVAFVLGLGVGTLAMSLLNLLYVVAEPTEVGRATAAHQYLRGLFQTYAAAMVGTIMLLVVSDRLGDVEAVRELLTGEVTSGDAATRDAVAAGFRLGHAVPLVLSVIGLVAGLRLWRRMGQPWRRKEESVAP